MVGNALASGESVYETDDDLELLGAALPFGLELRKASFLSRRIIRDRPGGHRRGSHDADRSGGDRGNCTP
jgi:hypothetical protein